MKIYGKKFQISGSASQDVDIDNLKYSHYLIKNLVQNISKKGGGFIINVGKEPLLENENISTIFDWTVLETIADSHKHEILAFPKNQGAPVIAFGLKNWEKNIPKNRTLLWNYLVKNHCVEVFQLKESMSFGGKLREIQSQYGDVLISLGGERGVFHSIDLYCQEKKPIFCLNIPLSKIESASEITYRKICENPKNFLDCDEEFNIVAYLSTISLTHMKDVDEFIINFETILNKVKSPKAFFIRLMKKDHEDFVSVENYFRNVVDIVIDKIGFQRFESGLDPSDEAFLNIEIFQNLHFCSFAVADVTGLRENCFLELGYSLGQQKRYILMAKEGTTLPFNTKMIPCHFWNLKNGFEIEQKKLGDFIEKNFNRNPLIQTD